MALDQVEGADARAAVVMGLGNPGSEYLRTRHNVGFMVLEHLARRAGGRWRESGNSRTCTIEIHGCSVLLAEPLTYMNRSGEAAHALLSEAERNGRDLLVIVDDLNLPFGRIRIRERGAAGGHHGLESIMTILRTDEIVRIRMGVGEEQMPADKASFVLSEFPPERQAGLDEMIIRAGEAVRSILTDGVSKTMSIYNA